MTLHANICELGASEIDFVSGGQQGSTPPKPKPKLKP